MPSSKTAVLVFSRAPVPGETKRRLIPVLGPERAADLHAQMLDAIVGSAAQADVGPVVVYCTPSTEHECFSRLRRDYGVTLREQAGGDLGGRLHAALADTLQHYPRALVVGSDCPSLTPDDISAAARALEAGYQAVIACATDGGYVLLGLDRLSRRLFEDIDWGSADVADATIGRLDELGWRYRTLEPHTDIDRPEDVEHAMRSLSRYRSRRKSLFKTVN